MIYTSNYKSISSTQYKTYSISGDGGKKASYQGETYPSLKPKYSFWKIWHDQIGKISEQENRRYYIEEYWEKVLKKLDPEEVYRDLDHSILLCYEESNEFCHRHIISSWLELFLNIEVAEIKIENNCLIPLERPNGIKEMVEEIIKKHRTMHGFSSLREAYLFEKGETILEERTNHYTKEKKLLKK